MKNNVKVLEEVFGEIWEAILEEIVWTFFEWDSSQSIKIGFITLLKLLRIGLVSIVGMLNDIVE